MKWLSLNVALKGLVPIVVLALISCGKNDGVRFVPNSHGYGANPMVVPQAPAPFNYYAPAAQFPNGYSSGSSPYFYPQMPQGYSAGYYPFLPIHNFMTQNPYRANYWQQFWNGWASYAGNQGYSQYDFTRFWLEYCPQQWSYSPWMNLYNYYDQSFYSWVTPQTQFPQNVNPGFFWQNYYGYSYQPIDLSYCFDNCYSY